MSSRIIDVEKKVFRKGAPGACLLFFVATVRQPALYNVTQLSSSGGLKSVQISGSTSKAAQLCRV